MKLSESQLRNFVQQGFLFLRGSFSTEEVAVLRRAADEVYALDRPEVWRESSGAPWMWWLSTGKRLDVVNEARCGP